jgi:hypothetical protein
MVGAAGWMEGHWQNLSMLSADWQQQHHDQLIIGTGCRHAQQPEKQRQEP